MFRVFKSWRSGAIILLTLTLSVPAAFAQTVPSPASPAAAGVWRPSAKSARHHRPTARRTTTLRRNDSTVGSVSFVRSISGEWLAYQAQLASLWKSRDRAEDAEDAAGAVASVPWRVTQGDWPGATIEMSTARAATKDASETLSVAESRPSAEMDPAQRPQPQVGSDRMRPTLLVGVADSMSSNRLGIGMVSAIVLLVFLLKGLSLRRKRLRVDHKIRRASATAQSPNVLGKVMDEPFGAADPGTRAPAEPKPNLSTATPPVAESKAAAKLLAGFFDKQGMEELPKSPIADDDGVLEPRLAGLLRALLKRHSWSRADFERLAREHQLTPGAALEGINSWGFYEYDECPLEDGDPIVVNGEVLAGRFS
jgi:hypothetical protein